MRYFISMYSSNYKMEKKVAEVNSKSIKLSTRKQWKVIDMEITNSERTSDGKRETRKLLSYFFKVKYHQWKEPCRDENYDWQRKTSSYSVNRYLTELSAPEVCPERAISTLIICKNRVTYTRRPCKQRGAAYHLYYRMKWKELGNETEFIMWWPK